jgi:polyphosphate:AMP phosphotransferase
MFETAELNRSVSKAEYEKREPAVRTELLELQQKLREAKFPLFVLINGVDGAGKGDAVNLLHEWMDPRYLRTYATTAPTEEERARPAYWRYWRILAAKGTTGIYFGNWYTDPIVERVFKRSSKSDFEMALGDIQAFERTLCDDGALVVKLWFHISKKEQKKRYEDLMKDKRTRWRVTQQDLDNRVLYDRFADVSERALRETSTGQAPWTVIEATDRRYRDLAVGETIAAALKQRLAASAAPPAKASKKEVDAPMGGKTILDAVDLKKSVDDKTYDQRLEELQGSLNRDFRKLKKAGRSVLAVFEGWDAAGKGGAIRRVTAALDARDYRVIPIAAPSDEEKAQHYLWRFWRHLPGSGSMTIYDRSWYGRVLVERVEGFCRPDEWQRAYQEINEFEEQLIEHGTVVVKFWLHIDSAEQLRRFKEREKTEYKRYKITDEDYRNRAKTPQYTVAVHDMVGRTSTEQAPWKLVAANDKRFARLTVLDHLCERIESAL